MLKVGLIGLGAMGRGHLEVYQGLEKENYPVELVAICDVNPEKFKNEKVDFNLSVGEKNEGLDKYRQFTDYKEMIAQCDLDYIDCVLPTYLHAETAIYAMERGLNVLCEKPMALNVEQCDAMIAAAERTGRRLMIAQTLRFWPAYEEVKKLLQTGEYGACVSADFFRGGSTPLWSFENWLLTKERSGGVVIDQHIHDVDAINWLFGIPDSVTASGRNVFPGSGYDAVSSLYHYPDGKVVTAQDDWSINGGDFGFEMVFRINFERGAAVLRRGGFELHPQAGEGEEKKSLRPDLPQESAYMREIKYFCECLESGAPFDRCPPFSTRETIRIARAEIESIDGKGKVVAL